MNLRLTEAGDHSPKHINATIEMVKNYLDGELAKYKTWEEVGRAEGAFSSIFENEGNFAYCKKHGSGRATIRAFMSKAWTDARIQQALATLKQDKDDIVDREAVATLELFSWRLSPGVWVSWLPWPCSWRGPLPTLPWPLRSPPG